MKNEPGTYMLVLSCRSVSQVPVGRWGAIQLQPGWYYYVGSAFGPGGVRARVLRHFRKSSVRRWHIDFLRVHLNPIRAMYSHDPKPLEHHWACTCNEMKDLRAFPGFGCSDCNCHSHLFFSPHAPNFTCLARNLEGQVEYFSPIPIPDVDVIEEATDITHR